MLTRRYLLEELGKCNSVCCGSIFELAYCLELIIDEDEMMWYIKNTTVYSCRTPAIYS
jgi:hypothetical protein